MPGVRRLWRKQRLTKRRSSQFYICRGVRETSLLLTMRSTGAAILYDMAFHSEMLAMKGHAGAPVLLLNEMG